MNDGGGGREVEAGPARLEAHDHRAHRAVVLEAVRHAGAALARDAPVQKVGALARRLGDPLLQTLAHLAELREDEDLSVALAALRQNFEKRHALAGVGLFRARAEELRGRVADLLQLHDEREHDPAALRERHRAVFAAKLSHRFVERLRVERRLFLRNRREAVDHVLFRQIPDDRLVRLHAADHEGRGQASEGFEARRIMVDFDRRRVLALKVRGRTEQSRHHDREDRPVFHQTVFDGRARHRDHGVGRERAHGARLRGGGVFDGLRFVEDDEAPAAALQNLHVTAKRAVARERHVGEHLRHGAVEPVVEPYGERGREAFDFARPVREHPHGEHAENLLFGEFSRFLQLRHRGDRLQSLAQPHVVGDEAAETEAQVLHEPGVAAVLIGAKFRVQILGDGKGLHVGEDAHALAKVVVGQHLGAAPFAREGRAQALEGVGRLLCDLLHVFEELRVEKDEFVVDRNDVADFVHELAKFLERHGARADRHLPAEFAERFAREETADAASGNRAHAGDQARAQKAAQFSGEHERHAEPGDLRRDLREEGLEKRGFERHRTAAVQEGGERGKGLHEGGEGRGRRVAVRLPAGRRQKERIGDGRGPELALFVEFLFLFARFGVELEFAVRGFAGENPEGELGSALRKARERERGHPRVEACELEGTEGREKQLHRTVREETVERRGVFAQKERRRQVRLFDVARVGGKERLDRVGERQKNDRAHAPFVFRNGHGRAGGRSLFTAYTFGLFVRGIVGCFVGGFVGEFGCREAGVCECLGVDEIVGTVGERGRERLKDGLDAVVLQRGHPEKTRSGVFDSGGPIENRTDLARKDQTRRGAHDRAARLDVAGHRFGFRVREGEKSRRFAGGRDFPFERFEFGVRQADAGAREKTFHGFSAQIGAARIDRRLKTHGQQKSVGIAEKRHEARLGGLGGVARIGGGRFALGKGFLAASTSRRTFSTRSRILRKSRRKRLR